MRLINFPEQTTIVAKDQPPYKPMPAWRDPSDPKGRTICCWELSILERLHVLWSGRK